MRLLKGLMLAGISAFTLAGCGGGGDGGGTAAEEALVKEKIFDLKSIHESYLSLTQNYKEIASGVSLGVNISSSGTRAITSSTASNFENSPALVVTGTRNGTTNVGGQISVYSGEMKTYFNLSKQQIGSTEKDFGSSVGNYGVVTTIPTSYPTSARIGDGGNLWTMDLYTDATKKQVQGTHRAAWQLKQGVGSAAALLEITRSSTMPNNPVLIKTVTEFSIDAQNKMRLTKEVIEGYDSTTVYYRVTYTFTDQ